MLSSTEKSWLLQRKSLYEEKTSVITKEKSLALIVNSGLKALFSEKEHFSKENLIENSEKIQKKIQKKSQ